MIHQRGDRAARMNRAAISDLPRGIFLSSRLAMALMIFLWTE
jgi:hypothetical protein